MATEPNYRNATGTQFPQIMVNTAGTYQYGVSIDTDYSATVFKRSIATGLVTATYNLDADAAAIAATIVPLSSVENSNSSHYGYALGVDDQERLHIAGNSLATKPNYIRSAPGDITSWTNLSWTSTTVVGAAGASHPLTLASGGGFTTYNTFDRLSDGTLMWHIDQREPTGGSGSSATGKDNLAFYLPVGTSTWQRMIPGSGSTVGEFMQSGNTAPDRVYFQGTAVDPNGPNGDRVWVVGVWRADWTQVTTSRCPFIVYSDDITDPNSWRSVDGAAQTMPITYLNCGYSASSMTAVSGSTIPIAHGTYTVFSGRIAFDAQGRPSLLFKAGGTTNDYYRVYWDGSAWQDEFVITTAYPGIFNIRNHMFAYYYESNRMKVRELSTGNTFKFGGEVPAPSGTMTGYLLPYPDPVRLRQGWLDLLIPDGDTPVVYSFGSHNRSYAE